MVYTNRVMTDTVLIPLVITFFAANLLQPYYWHLQHPYGSIDLPLGTVFKIFLAVFISYLCGAFYYKPKVDKWEEERKVKAHIIGIVRVSCPICSKQIENCPVCKQGIEPIPMCPLCKKEIVACSDCRDMHIDTLEELKLVFRR